MRNRAGWPRCSARSALQWAAGGLIALFAFATASAVLLASRNALGIHRETIEIVHMLGATDVQIARVFQRSMATDAAMGGVVGLLAGVVTVLGLARQFAALGSGMVAQALAWTDWLVLARFRSRGSAGDGHRPPHRALGPEAHADEKTPPRFRKPEGLFRRIGSALILVWMLGFLWFAWFLPQRAPDGAPPTASSC
jgi:hypothetical protein